MTELSNKEKQQIRTERILKALSGIESDRTAVIMNGNIGLAHYVDPTLLPGDCFLRPEYVIDKILESADKLDADGISAFLYPVAQGLSGTGGIKVSGREVPKEEDTQFIEIHYFKPEHYDYILENGTQAFLQDIVAPATGGYLQPEDFPRFLEVTQGFMTKLFNSAMSPFGCDAALYGPSILMYASFGRGFDKMLMDIRKYKDKVLNAMEMLDDVTALAPLRAQLSGEHKPSAVMPTLARCDDNAIGFNDFKKYVWSSIKRCEALIEEVAPETVSIYHIDGSYGSFINNVINDFRPGKTVLQLDGFTDTSVIADSVVKRGICVFGDVPPAMMTLGTPDDVYKHCIELKKQFGANLILAAGCIIPPYTPVANLEAMVAAAKERV